jgi:hypothetical protein
MELGVPRLGTKTARGRFVAALKGPHSWRKRRNGDRRAPHSGRDGHGDAVYPKDDRDRNRRVASSRDFAGCQGA